MAVGDLKGGWRRMEGCGGGGWAGSEDDADGSDASIIMISSG